MCMFDLIAEFDPHNSFHGKAKVHAGVLYSYGTEVARMTDDGAVELLEAADYSATTKRHVKEFQLQVEAGYIRREDV